MVLRDYPTLGVTPNWSVVERKDKFFIIESNAGFDIKDSLFVNSKIESYINTKLFLDFPECSLLLKIKYSMLPQEKENIEKVNGANQEKNDDGLPTFLPQTAENGGYPPTQNGDIRSLFWLFSLMALQN